MAASLFIGSSIDKNVASIIAVNVRNFETSTLEATLVQLDTMKRYARVKALSAEIRKELNARHDAAIAATATAVLA